MFYSYQNLEKNLLFVGKLTDREHTMVAYSNLYKFFNSDGRLCTGVWPGNMLKMLIKVEQIECNVLIKNCLK